MTKIRQSRKYRDKNRGKQYGEKVRGEERQKEKDQGVLFGSGRKK